MKWITGIKIFFIVLLLGIGSYAYHFFTDDSVKNSNYENVPDLSSAYRAEEEIAQAKDRLKDPNLEPAQVVTHKIDGEKVIALTFDGLPRKATLDRLLDVLDDHRAPATFFAEGGNVAADPKTVEVIEDKAQALGNYTYVGLAKLEKQPQEQVIKELCMAQKVFSVTGNFEPDLFKAPQSKYDINMLRLAAASGLKAVVRTDYFLPADQVTDVAAAGKLLAAVKPGSIVSIVVNRPIDVFKRKEGKKEEKPAFDKQPSLVLGNKAVVKHEDIVEVTDRFLTACEQQGVKVIPLKKMRMVRLVPPKSTLQKVIDKVAFLCRDAFRLEATAYAAEPYADVRAKNRGALAEEQKMILSTEQAIAFCFSGFTKPEATKAVLDRLQFLDAKGTFFVGVNDINNNEALLRRAVKEGHELGIAVYSKKSGSFATVCRDIEATKKLLQQKFGVQTNLVKQPWGAVADYTREAVSAMGCQLIGQNVNVVQSRHKDYTSANDVLSELFGKFVYSLGRGWIISFRMDYYTDPNLCADVMQLLKEKKIDNIAYWSFDDDPKRNLGNDSAYEIKSVGSILNNTAYTYTLPALDIPARLHPDYNDVDGLPLRDYIAQRYIGTKSVNQNSNTLGFTREELRYLDTKGVIHTNRPVVFFGFDDWGTDAPINQLLYVLRKHNVKGTFFILARNVKNNPNLLRAIAEEGHDIACHTYNHKPMVSVGERERLYTTQTEDERVDDYLQAYAELARITGDVVVDGKPSLTRLFRPPTLTISKAGFKALQEAGYEYVVSGSTSTHDYMMETLYEMVDSIRAGLYEDKTCKKVKNGAVFVMHMSDSSKYTARALDILFTLNEEKDSYDPSRFEVGRLSDYLIDGYDQSNRSATLSLQAEYGQ